MAGQKDYLKYGVVILAIVAVVYIASATGYLSASTLGGAGGGNIGSNGVCSASTGLTNVQALNQYLDVSTNTETQVNTSFAAYAPGAPVASISSTTPASGGYSTMGTYNCNQPLTVFGGDSGTTYYYQQKSLTGGQTNGANTQVAFELKKSSAATMTLLNGQTGVISTTANITGVGSGAANSDVTLNVKASQYYYGDGAVEVCALYNTSNITSVSFGATATPIAVDGSISLAAGQAIKCYELAGDMNNYAVKPLPVVIQAKAGVTPVASTIDIKLNDKSAYIKNGVAMVGYFNADTLADIGLAVVSQASAVKVN